MCPVRLDAGAGGAFGTHPGVPPVRLDDGAGLASGDVIASLNGVPILNIQELRKAAREMTGHKSVVLQIERHGRFLYIEPDFEDRPSVSGTDRDATSDSKTVPARDRH